MEATEVPSSPAAGPEAKAASETEVIVVGAGPTGLMAALLLARRGVRVRVFDQNTQQAHESRALGVQARSLELFLSLGFVDRFFDRGAIVTGGRMFVDGESAAAFSFDNIGRTDTPYSSLLVVPQRDTEAILNDELGRLGVAVERQVEVTGFEQTAAGVTVHATGADGAAFEARAAFLVGADGAHSIVRKMLGLTFAGAAYPQGFLLADCRTDLPLEPDRMTFFLRGKHFAVCFPLPGEERRVRIIVSQVVEADAHAPVESQGGTDVPLAEVQAALRSAVGRGVTLSDPIWSSRYKVHHRGVDRYRVGRVFVAGDAAHIHSPAGGQGMNTGLQDAANLAWKLVLALRGQAGLGGLLDSYHDERWPVGQRVLAYTDRMFSAMTSQSDWITGLRNVLLPRLAGPLMHTEFIRAKAFHFVSQLGIRYEGGAAVQDGAAPTGHGTWEVGPAPGHRAPNAAYARNRDVFGLLTDYRFHVVALSRQGLAPAEIGALRDGLAALPPPPGMGLAVHVIAYLPTGPDERILRAESGEAFTAYGVSHETPQALYLVRPDGYIAWRADRLDLAALAAFLRERFC